MADTDPLVDVDALMSLTAELHQLNSRLAGAAFSDDQQRRWQRQLAAIAEGASADIERARAQLRRLAAQLDRA